MISIELIAKTALARNSLELRSLVQDLIRTNPVLRDMDKPQTDDPRILSTAAALVELLAERTDQIAPDWAKAIGAIPEPFFLLEAAEHMQRLRLLCETTSSEPLRKRGLYAPPDFLDFV